MITIARIIKVNMELKATPNEVILLNLPGDDKDRIWLRVDMDGWESHIGDTSQNG